MEFDPDDRYINIYWSASGATQGHKLCGRIVSSWPGGKLLSENFPYDKIWGYCSNNNSFWAAHPSRTDLQSSKCPPCGEIILRRYLCDTCKVMSLEESKTKEKREFKLSEDHTPEPYCPGCQSSPPSTWTGHECSALQVSFTTALAQCPFCRNRIDPKRPLGTGARVIDFVEALRVRGRDVKERLTGHAESRANEEGMGHKEAAPLSEPIQQPTNQPFAASNENPSASVNPSRASSYLRERFSIFFGIPLAKANSSTIPSGKNTAVQLNRSVWPWLRKPIVWLISGLGLFAAVLAIKDWYPKYSNHPPILKEIRSDKERIRIGEVVTLTAHADDEDGGIPRYKWYCPQGRIQGEGAIVELITKDMNLRSGPIDVTVKVIAEDKYSESAPLEKKITVNPPNWRNRTPTVTVKYDERYEKQQQAQSGELVTFTADAKDEDEDDHLTYEWERTPLGSMEKDGRSVKVNTSDIIPSSASAPIQLIVRAKVDDGHGGTASNERSIWIVSKRKGIKKGVAHNTPRPASPYDHSPGLVRFQPDRSTIQAGESVALTAEAADQDRDDTLTFIWKRSPTIGKIVANGDRATFDTTGVSINEDVPVIITLTVLDGRGGNASQTVIIIVKVSAIQNSKPNPAPNPKTPPQESNRNSTAAFVSSSKEISKDVSAEVRVWSHKHLKLGTEEATLGGKTSAAE